MRYFWACLAYAVVTVLDLNIVRFHVLSTFFFQSLSRTQQVALNFTLHHCLVSWLAAGTSARADCVVERPSVDSNSDGFGGRCRSAA